MTAFKQRWNYLFRSTKGLALVNIALISLVTAFFGMLSGPMQEFGISAWIIKTFNLVMIEAEREGRIIMLYHTIAVAVVSLEVYFITNIVPMKAHERSQINATVTFGYILTMICGLGFAYWGHNFVFHGLYLFGMSLSFFGGILLAAALWPWKKEYRISLLPGGEGPGERGKNTPTCAASTSNAPPSSRWLLLRWGRPCLGRSPAPIGAMVTRPSWPKT